MAALLGVLNREVSRADIQSQAPDLLATVREMVDEGTNLFGRLLTETNRVRRIRPFHTALLLFFRHTIELLDAVDELFRGGIFTPAALQVRAIVEAHMQILYLFGMRTEYLPSVAGPGSFDPVPRDGNGVALMGQALEDVRDDRGLAYIVAEYRRLARQAASYDAASLAQLAAKYNITLPPQITDPTVHAGIAAEAVKFQTQLSTPEFAPIDAAFTAARGTQPYDPPWYSLAGGPKKVRRLAESVGLMAYYEMFYGDASEVMHGTNIGGQLGQVTPGGGTAAAPLRNFDMAAQVGRCVIMQIMPIYQLAIRALRPSDMGLWQQWTQRWAPIAGSLR
jgi:hypothetical protein